MSAPTRDELEIRLSRLQTSEYRYRRSSAMYYDALRKLENKIREAATQDTLPTRQILTDLAREVPKHPRPTLTELRRGHHRRMGLK